MQCVVPVEGLKLMIAIPVKQALLKSLTLLLNLQNTALLHAALMDLTLMVPTVEVIDS